jgi:hypothetical protein
MMSGPRLPGPYQSTIVRTRRTAVSAAEPYVYDRGNPPKPDRDERHGQRERKHERGSENQQDLRREDSAQPRGVRELILRRQDDRDGVEHGAEEKHGAPRHAEAERDRCEPARLALGHAKPSAEASHEPDDHDPRHHPECRCPLPFHAFRQQRPHVLRSRPARIGRRALQDEIVDDEPEYGPRARRSPQLLRNRRSRFAHHVTSRPRYQPWQASPAIPARLPRAAHSGRTRRRTPPSPA